MTRVLVSNATSLIVSTKPPSTAPSGYTIETLTGNYRPEQVIGKFNESGQPVNGNIDNSLTLSQRQDRHFDIAVKVIREWNRYMSSRGLGEVASNYLLSGIASLYNVYKDTGRTQELKIAFAKEAIKYPNSIRNLQQFEVALWARRNQAKFTTAKMWLTISGTRVSRVTLANVADYGALGSSFNPFNEVADW